MHLPLEALTAAIANESALAAVRMSVRNALASEHLVDVARAVGAPEYVLDAIGVPVDVLASFPGWRSGNRTFDPPRLGLRPVASGAAHPLGPVRIQLSPYAATVPSALGLARALVRAREGVVLVAPPGTLVEELRWLTGAEVVLGPSETVFARDAAFPMRDGSEPVLLIPRAIDPTRGNDALSADSAAALRVRVRRSALYWEGGNLLYDGERLLIGADVVAENRTRLGLADHEVLALFAAEMGETPLVLGGSGTFDPVTGRLAESGQASFHLDLDVATLGRYARNRRPRALVADVAWGLRLLPHVLATRALFRDHLLPGRWVRERVVALWEDRAREHHARLLDYAATLESAGYRVVPVPDLRIDPAEDIFRPANFDLNYCNLLPGFARGVPAVRWLPLGVGELDRAFEATLSTAGLGSAPVTRDPRLAHRLLAYNGGLRCATGLVPTKG